jgi:hypothetical protein
MKQLKVALPDDLRARLDAASAKSGRSVADEIRMRVEASFARDALDESTRGFLDHVARMPAAIERETGAAWYSHAGAHQVFRQMLLKALARLRPDGLIAFGKRRHQSIPGDDPEDIGNSLESHLWRNPNYLNSEFRRGSEETFREILEIHRQNQRKGHKS